MSAPSSPCVLIVADPGRIAELAAALEAPLPQGEVDVATSTGGDDTLDLYRAHHPEVVIITATLEFGDARSLVQVLRSGRPRGEVAIVLVGDDTGPIRTPLDAGDFTPEKFITRPLSAKALRFAVATCLETVALVRGAASGPIAPHAAQTLPRANGEVARVDDDPTGAAPVGGTRSALRARWEALADSIGDDDEVEEEPAVVAQPAPLPPRMLIQPRNRTTPGISGPWHVPMPPEARDLGAPAEPVEVLNAEPTAPSREPTLIIPDAPAAPARNREPSDPPQNVVVLERGEPEEHWSEPVPMAALTDRDSIRDFDDDLGLDEDLALDREDLPPPPVVLRGGALEAPGMEGIPLVGGDPPPAVDERVPARDFARQLREKMSMMAQRLFQADSQPAVDVGPKHDHHTEIDLAALAEEPVMAQVTEIERVRELTTSPGSWDTQVRERGLPDSGEIVRGVSDAGMLLAKMFMQAATGRVGFRRDDAPTGAIEKVVYFDQGRPVFASSNEPGDRMGELLVREGKITAAQYERCQSHVAESGRRMGEILVDFGYLKRRELLPAVRRHVEDIVYSLFGWDLGHYRITLDTMPSAERIRLSRHAASLILEGIRRKLDRTTLERLVGPPSTVVEVADRERLGGVINSSDLGAEERAALAAFDGQSDIAQIARTTSIDIADVLPLVWGLCVLGLATVRRAEVEVLDESSALVGETDLAIDRERVRARWQLVTEADYFALLGVRRDATGFEIRRAYQSARRDFAADCFPTDLRRELARELDDIANVLDEAFRVLRDDRLRLTYLSNLVE